MKPQKNQQVHTYSVLLANKPQQFHLKALNFI